MNFKKLSRCVELTELTRRLLTREQYVSVSNINSNLKFYKNLNSPNRQTCVILDGDCKRSEEFLQKCGDEGVLGRKYHWLILSKLSNTTQKFENVNLNIDADIQVAVANNTGWTIIDVYNPAASRGGKLFSTPIGSFTKKQGYDAQIDQPLYWIRKNMTGVTFKTMVVLPVPFEGTLIDYLNSDDDRDINTFNRFHSRLVHFCRDYYNFSMDIALDKSWGYTNPDGTFDGMVGALERSEIDFGSSPLFVRTDRGQVIDYGRLTWTLRASFIFRNPKSMSSLETFLKPFSVAIWFILAGFMALFVIITKSVTTFERRRYHRHSDTSWSLSILFTLGAFCQQGFPKPPTMTCGRIATFFVFLLSVLTYQFYSASIVSNLLMKPGTSIRTLKNLLDSTLKVGCEDILYTRDYLKHTPDPVAIELYKRKIRGRGGNYSNFLAPEAGLDLVERGGYAFHVEVATAYPLIQHNFPDGVICELREVQMFPTQPMHANYQKYSHFRDMLDTCLQRLGEIGIIFRELKHWHPRRPECIQSSKYTANVGLEEFYPALLVLLFGVIMSLILLLMERYLIAKPSVLDEERFILPFVK